MNNIPTTPEMQWNWLTCGLMISAYMFLANTELVAKMQESADDITAAEIAPIPMMLTGRGVKYVKVKGRM